MFQHSNSRLTPRGRQRLVERVRAGESVPAVAREAGVSRQTARKWIARAEAGEPLSDRRSRVAYAELLGDEREETCAAFMGRAWDFYRGLGVEVERVMTDSGPGHRSRLFNEWLAASGIARRYARPYSPWQNGKVERMNRTLAQEWQYARACASEEERAAALPSFIDRCNWARPHSACSGLPPMSRIVGVNNVMAHNS